MKLVIIKLFQSYLISKINHKLLRIFGDSFVQFKQLLQESTIAISGSFLLETILNEDYGGDIDLYQVGYCENDNFSVMDTYMYTISNINSPTDMIDTDGWIHCYGPIFNTGSDLIRKITNYTINGKKVQIVHLDNSKHDDMSNTANMLHIKSHVADFVFDICKNV